MHRKTGKAAVDHHARGPEPYSSQGGFKVKVELRKDLTYETLQTRTRDNISLVSYRRSYFDKKNQIKGLRPARSRNWANLNSLLDEGFVRLQNAAKLNFLAQTVLELGRVL